MQFNERELEELAKLHRIVEKRQRELALDQLAVVFKGWDKKKSYSKAEAKIKEYVHLEEGVKHQDSQVVVADALSNGILKKKDLSKGLYESLELVIRLMQN